MEKYLENIGEAFSGAVYKLPVDKLDSFYNDSMDLMSESGRKAFFRTIGVPQAFFERHDADLRMDIIIAQKAIVREKGLDIDLLYFNGEFQFAAFHSEYAIKDPREFLGIDPSRGWLLLREDLNRGIFRYVYRGEIDKDEVNYKPVAFIDCPIFYFAPVKMEMGLLRAVCFNSLVEPKRNHRMVWKPTELGEGLAEIIARVAQTVSMNAVDTYADFLNHYEGSKMTLVEAREMMNNFLLEDPRRIPKSVVVECQKTLDDIEDEHVIDGPVPKKITSEMDVINLLTYYAKDLSSVSAQTRTEGRLMNMFWEKYVALEGDVTKSDIIAYAA
jgi:hypothetical protein